MTEDGVLYVGEESTVAKEDPGRSFDISKESSNFYVLTYIHVVGRTEGAGPCNS